MHRCRSIWLLMILAGLGASSGCGGGDSDAGGGIDRPPEVTIFLPADGASFIRGTSISFSGRAVDPEDGVLTGEALVWNSDVAGDFGTGPLLTTSGLAGATHVITLRATDSHGNAGSASITIQVRLRDEPVVTIAAPAAGMRFTTDDIIEFAGSAVDEQDGELAGEQLVWSSNNDGQIGTGRSFARTLSHNSHVITLRATDSDGDHTSVSTTVYVNPVQIEGFVYLPPGTFIMGSPPDEPGRNLQGLAELQHEVSLTRGFFMSRFETTEREWDTVMGGGSMSELPADSVSWNDIIRYCNQRSLQEGLRPAYTVSANDVTWNRLANGYRLPTEAEWEYACRAGSPTAFANGALDSTQLNWTRRSAVLDEIAWYLFPAGVDSRQVGGLKIPNAWGLYDMHGNVWEWVWDYRSEYLPGYTVDPAGPPTGQLRMFRGGGMWHWAIHARCAYRGVGDHPGRLYNDLGFRVVRTSF